MVALGFERNVIQSAPRSFLFGLVRLGGYLEILVLPTAGCKSAMPRLRDNYYIIVVMITMLRAALHSSSALLSPTHFRQTKCS